MRARRSLRVFDQAPERDALDDQEEDDEVRRGDDDPEQVDLELRRLGLLGRRQGDLAQDLPGEGEGVHGRHRVPRVSHGGLDEDREQADDDREDAEALGERREDDREAADLAGRIGVAADRAGGQAGEDADADARADDAEGREGADVFHVPCSLRGPGLVPGAWSRGRVVSAPPLRRRGSVASADSAASCSSPWPSIATSVNMRVRVAKISAWTRLSSTSRASIAMGMIARVRAVSTPSATSPP